MVGAVVGLVGAVAMAKGMEGWVGAAAKEVKG